MALVVVAFCSERMSYVRIVGGDDDDMMALFVILSMVHVMWWCWVDDIDGDGDDDGDGNDTDRNRRPE
jgi:hypothetical protein